MLEKDKTFNGASSAFKPVLIKSERLCELEALTDQLISQRRKVKLMEVHSNQKEGIHPFVQIILSMVLSLQREIGHGNSDSPECEMTQFSFHLLKNLAEILENNLFQIASKYDQQLSTSILFEKSLLEIFKRYVLLTNQKAQNLTIAHLNSILNGLSQQNYREKYLDNIYAMLGGSFFLIGKENFENSLQYMIWNIGKIFTSKSNFITRNLKNTKRGKIVNDILNCSVKLICSYQNKEFIRNQIQRASFIIFGQEKNLRKDQFIEMLRKAEKHQVSHLIWLFVDLLKAESLIVMDSEVKSKIEHQNQVEHSNFYVQEMQKLLKKCPYNGDQCCNCKKCQCVRRNRESAKLSQQKKRNAVEQLDPMKKRIAELERRNKELEEENSILKGIFNDIKDSEGFRQILSSTLDPISKVLHD